MSITDQALSSSTIFAISAIIAFQSRRHPQPRMNSAGGHAGPTIYFVIVVAPFPFSSTETKLFTAFVQCSLFVQSAGSD
jgi:hypothetical protein